jgi:hypothetical protein
MRHRGSKLRIEMLYLREKNILVRLFINFGLENTWLVVLRGMQFAPFNALFRSGEEEIAQITS